jgi:CheY-like chemotaxis protein
MTMTGACRTMRENWTDTCPKPEYVPGAKMDNRRILVVDDSSSFRTLMVHVLDFMGYEVATASDGEEALSKIDIFEPHLILMDVEMPVLDGYEACRLIKANPECNIPVLLVSANRYAEDGAFDAGADDFLAKPFSLDDLVVKIKSLTTLDAPLVSAAAFGALSRLA